VCFVFGLFLWGGEVSPLPNLRKTICDERMPHIAKGSGCIETSSSASHAHQPPHIQAGRGLSTCFPQPQ
jgi:hypothetical protein